MRVFLSNTIGHMCCNGAHFCSTFHMKHLVIKVYVRSYLLQHGPLWSSSQEQSLICLKAPGSEGLQSTDTRAGSRPCCHQVGADGAVKTMTFCIELLLQLSQSFQKTLKWTLEERFPKCLKILNFPSEHNHWLSLAIT